MKREIYLGHCRIYQNSSNNLCIEDTIRDVTFIRENSSNRRYDITVRVMNTKKDVSNYLMYDHVWGNSPFGFLLFEGISTAQFGKLARAILHHTDKVMDSLFDWFEDYALYIFEDAWSSPEVDASIEAWKKATRDSERYFEFICKKENYLKNLLDN